MSFLSEKVEKYRKEYGAGPITTGCNCCEYSSGCESPAMGMSIRFLLEAYDSMLRSRDRLQDDLNEAEGELDALYANQP